MSFLDDLRASWDLFGKIEAGKYLSAEDRKAFDAIKERHGLSAAGTLPTQKALADCLGVARQTVIRWKDEGMPVEPDGTYNPVRIASWRDLVRAPKTSTPDAAEQPRGGAPEDGIDHDNEYRKWKARLAELTYRKAAGELIERSEVEQLLTDRAVEFRRSLLGRGRRLALNLVGMTAAEIQAALEEDAIELLRTYTRPHQLGTTSAEIDIKMLENMAG